MSPRAVTEDHLRRIAADATRAVDRPGWSVHPVVGRRYARLELRWPVRPPVAGRDLERRLAYGFVDLADGCLLRAVDGRPDPVPRGSLLDPLDPSGGRTALGPRGVRRLDDPALDPSVLRALRARCASAPALAARPAPATTAAARPASPSPAAAGEGRARLEAALLGPDPAGALRAGLAEGWLDALVPELRAEMDRPQRTRWHALSVLEHSLATCAAMPPVLVERLAGLLHDLGKRRTAGVDPRTGDERYLGHAAAGAALAGPILERLGLDPSAVATVVRLVERHMDLHDAAAQGWSDRARARLRARLGDDLPVLQRLQLADIAAMHPDLVAVRTAEARALPALLAADAAAAASPGRPSPPARDPADLVAGFPRPPVAPGAPRLVVVAGLPASGKSHLARAVAARVPAAHLASDAVRMALTAGSPTYGGGESILVHATVRRIAAALLREGRHVLLDATSIRPRDRRALLGLGGHGTIVVWCEADEATAAARLGRRSRGEDPLDASQADAAVRARMAAAAVPPAPGEAGTVIVCRPSDVDAVRDRLVRLLAGPGVA